MTVRLDVSEDEWCRNKDMEPQRRGSVPPLHTRKGNRTLGLSKTTLGGGVHVQPVGLNAETKKDRHRADGERCLLTFPYIGLLRFRDFVRVVSSHPDAPAFSTTEPPRIMLDSLTDQFIASGTTCFLLLLYG